MNYVIYYVIEHIANKVRWTIEPQAKTRKWVAETAFLVIVVVVLL